MPFTTARSYHHIIEIFQLYSYNHKVLLLGVTGNVGSRMLPALIKHGHTVVAYVRSTNKVTLSVRAALDDVVIGSATDTLALKNAILTYSCDAVFHAAGSAQLWGSKTGEYNTIFSAVVAAIVEARRERHGAAIRAWLMSGFPMMDSVRPTYLIGDYIPLFPEHRKKYRPSPNTRSGRHRLVTVLRDRDDI
jgi:hypothetical protein